MYGLSFMIRDKANQKFFEYLIPLNNPVKILHKIPDIIAERTVLKENFEKITIIHHNTFTTLVPEALFTAELAADYLKYNVRLLPNDVIHYQPVVTTGAQLVFVAFEGIEKFFQGKNINKTHSAGFFFENIQNIRNYRQDLPVFEVFLNVFPEDFQIAVYRNEKLLGYNHFEYHSVDDFLYYLFFVWETLRVSAEQCKIYVMGIDSQNETVQNLKDFHSNIEIIPEKNPSQIYNYF